MRGYYLVVDDVGLRDEGDVNEYLMILSKLVGGELEV